MGAYGDTIPARIAIDKVAPLAHTGQVWSQVTVGAVGSSFASHLNLIPSARIASHPGSRQATAQRLEVCSHRLSVNVMAQERTRCSAEGN